MEFIFGSIGTILISLACYIFGFDFWQVFCGFVIGVVCCGLMMQLKYK